MNLTRAVSARLAQALLTALGASLLVWALLPLAPGDPALRVLISRGVTEPTPREVAAQRAELGLDRPLVEQYGDFLLGAVRGDLGNSYQSGQPVVGEIAAVLPATALLAGVALALALLAAIPAALIAAGWAGRRPDGVLRAISLLGSAIPEFLIGLVILYVAALGLDWIDVVADGTIASVWAPAIALAIPTAAIWSRLLRASLLEALGSRYILVARARGASRVRVLVRHALPNAALPFLTAIGLGVGALLGGAVIVERVFSWPGLGSYVLTAISARDLAVVQGFAAVSALIFVTTSLLVDLAGTLLDPRIRTAAS